MEKINVYSKSDIQKIVQVEVQKVREEMWVFLDKMREKQFELERKFRSK